MIADGPGALYLEHHCATLTWVICADVNHLPTSDEDFLWTPGGIWDMAAPAQQEQLRKEETPLAIATLRTYPLQESEIATRNFLHQLVFFGPEDFHNYTIFNKSALDAMAPGLWSEYQRARQDHNAMPQAFFEILQIPVIALSVAAIVFLLPWFWKRRQAAVSMRLLGLAVIVIPVVIANAFLTGALSGVYTRYQGRVIWITGLLALLMLQTWWYERHTNTR
jgi:hypothetical protein